jgi:phage terminase large subunit-like protein
MTQDYLALREMGISMEAFRSNETLREALFDQYSGDPGGMADLLSAWEFLARDEQLPPTDVYKIWLYLAGRGSGKTRTGAEWTRDLAKKGYRRMGLIAPTAADARDVMIEGESGLLSVCQDTDVDHKGVSMGVPLYEPSKRRVTWDNGAMVTVYSADEPERLRGPQHDALWLDELAAWRKMETYDQAMFGLRLGKHPKIFISTTPKPKALIKRLHAQAINPSNHNVVMTSGSSERNSENLAPGVIEELREAYAGSELGRQELDGVLLEELEGALWNRKMIDSNRVATMPTSTDEDFYFERIVVSVDPATTSTEQSDETGIVVAGLGSDKHGYVLADYTGKYSPKGWATKVQWARKLWAADLIVAEKNQGGDMVKHVLTGEDENMPVRLVHASKGKKARAEPVAQKYEQGKVHHVGVPKLDANGLKIEGHLENLEDQMCTWEHLSSSSSPDRIDALVWAIHELMIAGAKPIVTTRLRGMH